MSEEEMHIKALQFGVKLERDARIELIKENKRLREFAEWISDKWGEHTELGQKARAALEGGDKPEV